VILMNSANIGKRQAVENSKYEAAKAIRKILDKVREEAEKAGYDATDLEEEILGIVTEEDPEEE
jgi:hypothetical protein